MLCSLLFCIALHYYSYYALNCTSVIRTSCHMSQVTARLNLDIHTRGEENISSKVSSTRINTFYRQQCIGPL